MLMMNNPKNLEFEPMHPKNVLIASVVHGISCFFCTFDYSVGWHFRKLKAIFEHSKATF
jgi:hypothetical protein